MSSLGLIGDYGSDSEEEEEHAHVKNELTQEVAMSDKKAQGMASTSARPLGSALLGSGGSPDLSEDSDDDRVPQKRTQPAPVKLLPPPPKQRAPSFDPKQFSSSSVFMTESQKEEMLNKRILSQHVNLTEFKDESQKKKMGPCRAFKRGECRRGDKCRFMHTPGRKVDESNKGEAVVSSQPTLYSDSHDVFKKKPKY